MTAPTTTAGHEVLPQIPPFLPFDRRACAPEGASARRRGRLKNGARPGDFLAAPRCGARTRIGGGCRQPAMRNGRCRMHGGLSTGPRTAEGRARCAAARRTHGGYSAANRALQAEARALIRRMRALRLRLTAGHGVLPRKARPASAAIAPQLAPDSIRVHRRSSAVANPSPAGHGVLPSVAAPARRPSLVQRCLLGSTALGLGLTVRPPFSAGHGVLPQIHRPALDAAATP